MRARLLLAGLLLAGCSAASSPAAAPSSAAAPVSAPASAPAVAPSSAAPSPSVPPDPNALPFTGVGGGHAPTAAQVAAAVAKPLATTQLGGTVHALVLDPATGATLLDRGGDVPAEPASTLKLLTAVGALTGLGPAYRIRTTVVTTARVTADGVLHGDLVLVGAGDPTLTAGTPTLVGQATLADLATRVKAAGVRRVTGRVTVDDSLFAGGTTDPGWHASYVTEGSVAPVDALEVDGGRTTAAGMPASDEPAPRAADPGLAGAGLLEARLRAAGVSFGLEPVRGNAGAGARAVAAVVSAPVVQLVQRMLTVSDNDLAEALGRLVSLHAGGAGTAAGASAAVTTATAGLGVPPAGVALSDTSGLSVDDRVPAATLVAALRLVVGAGHPELRPIVAGLPVAGRTGTLEKRYLTTPAKAAAGRVHAKTGALIGVSTEAGFTVTAGGRLLLFSFGTDVGTSRGDDEAALDRAAAALTALR